MFLINTQYNNRLSIISFWISALFQNSSVLLPLELAQLINLADLSRCMSSKYLTNSQSSSQFSTRDSLFSRIQWNDYWNHSHYTFIWWIIEQYTVVRLMFILRVHGKILFLKNYWIVLKLRIWEKFVRFYRTLHYNNSNSSNITTEFEIFYCKVR